MFRQVGLLPSPGVDRFFTPGRVGGGFAGRVAGAERGDAPVLELCRREITPLCPSHPGARPAPKRQLPMALATGNTTVPTASDLIHSRFSRDRGPPTLRPTLCGSDDGDPVSGRPFGEAGQARTREPPAPGRSRSRGVGVRRGDRRGRRGVPGRGGPGVAGLPARPARQILEAPRRAGRRRPREGGTKLPRQGPEGPALVIGPAGGDTVGGDERPARQHAGQSRGRRVRPTRP